VCLYTFKLLLVLTVHTHGEMARLSLPGWLGYQDSVPVNSHPSQYQPDSMISNFIDATNNVTVAHATNSVLLIN